MPLNDSVILFGGCCEDINYLPYIVIRSTPWTCITTKFQSKIVASFADGSWRKIGELKSGRYGHSVTALDNTVLVIGGLIEEGNVKVNSPSPTEKWLVDPQHVSFNSTNVKPLLHNYFFWPLTFNVPFDFC